jgi:endonuclease/exonuclease/phosphatase family metal-dependent hydrolase
MARVACLLVLVLAGCGGSPERDSTYALMQMNLCLSGLAGCYAKTAYPAVVEEATAQIRKARPDAVTINEACRADVALIARRTGYHARFSRVVYRGRRLQCVRPGGRGLFGDALLTKVPIESADNEAFKAQAGLERRRWLCVTTAREVDVCTAHLNTQAANEVAGNEAQCAELKVILARRAAARPVVFGGDINRRRSCAPRGAWTRTDHAARQASGLQHVYGSRTLRSPTAVVLPAEHTDHDFLLVRARVSSGRY